MDKILVDLHTHSTCSDGAYSPLDLYKKIKTIAGNRKVVWSLTDHDKVDGYKELEKINDDNIKIIKGCEFGFAHNGKLKDMLGYDIDLNKAKKFLDNYYTHDFVMTRQSNLLNLLKQMCDRNGLKYEEGLEIHTGKIGEAYGVILKSIKKYEENFKICPDLNDTGFFRKHLINPKSPFFTKEKYFLPSMKEIIDLIHSFGGKAFLAHSFDYSGESVEDVLKILDDAREAGVDGLEIMHYSITKEKEKILREYIKKYNLLESGGSDFHGETVKHDVSLFTGKNNNMNIEIENLTWIK